MDKEENKGGKSRRDYILPASILVAALIVGVALVYNAGMRDSSANNPSPSARTQEEQLGGIGSALNVKPVSADDHIFGDPGAPVKIIEFSDLECPFCKQFHQTMRSAMSLYEGRVAWVFRNFPLTQLHSKAMKEAQAAECAAKLEGNDAFWQYIDAVFEITPSNNGLDEAQLPKIAERVGINVNDFNTCLSGEYGKDIILAQSEDAVNSGAQGTPYSVIIAPDGSKSTVNGAMPLEQVKSAIDAALRKTN